MTVLKRRPLQHKAAAVAFAQLAGVGVSDAGALFTAPPPAAGVGALLDALPANVERVYLVGPVPGVEWFVQLDQASAWRPSPRGHFLAPGKARTGRYVDQGGNTVEVREAREWFAGGDYTVTDARDAWALLARMLPAAFGEGAALLGSPAGTGQYALARALPANQEYPPPPDDVAELIRATTTQGRVELCPVPRAKLPAFCYLDGRMMYAALTRELPCELIGQDAGDVDARVYGVKVPTDHDGRGVVPYMRARYWVTFAAPRDWSHVGLLLVPGDGAGKWHAPMMGTCWVEGPEVELAVRHGWRVIVNHRLIFRTGRPLETWTAKLVKLRGDVAGARDATPAARALAGAAVRAMLLYTIGTFHQSGQDVTHVALRAEDAPADKPAMMHGDAWVWTERRDVAGMWRAYMQPQWSAAVWGRCRARLLDGPGDTGALHLDRADVLGFRTDALYLTRDPRWPDDGQPGRFRVKGYIGRPTTTPAAWQRGELDTKAAWDALNRLRDRAARRTD